MKVRHFARGAALAILALPAPGFAQVADEPTPSVVLLNLAANPKAGKHAVAELRAAVEADPGVRNIAPGPLANALARPIDLAAPDRDLSVLAEAKALIEAARTDRIAMDAARRRVGLARLDRAESMLVHVPPGPESTQLLAELNFETALIYVQEADPERAIAAFRVSQRLAPGREPPSPTQHFDEVINLYKQAAEPQSATAKIRVTAPFDGATVWADGQETGLTPLEVTVTPGTHYFWATFPEWRPFGAKAVAGPDAAPAVDLQLQRIPVQERAQELRRRLLTRAAPPTVDDFRAVCDQVAEFTGAPLVMVITERRDRILVATYDRERRQLTKWRPLRDDRARSSARAIVAALPGRIDLVIRDPGADAGLDLKPIGDDQSWWPPRPGYLAIGGAGILVSVGLYLLLRPSDSPAPPLTGSCCGDAFGP